MAIFLILAPFGAFAALMMLTTASVSLFTAAAIGLAVVAYDALRGRSLKMLGGGAAMLFAGLGCYVTLLDRSFSNTAVIFVLDSGLLAVALLSIALRVPFTLQYARENVAPEITVLPSFLKVNYVLTWAWAAAITLMLFADALSIYLPSLPVWIGAGIAFAARNGAVYFTKWYPQYRVARLAHHA